MPKPFGQTKKAQLYGLLQDSENGVTLAELTTGANLSSLNTGRTYLQDAAGNGFVQIREFAGIARYRWHRNRDGQKRELTDGWRMYKIYPWQ